jgi:O-antigen/teichoic acid export membrane protein
LINKLKNKKLLVFLDQALVSGSNFVLGILLARYLGVAGYGQFALLWLIVLFFSSLQLAYIISPMLTLGAKKSLAILDKYLSTMMLLQLLFTFFLMICLYLFFEIAQLFDERWNVGDLEYIIILTTMIFLFQDFIRRYFIIKAQYIKLLLIDSIAYIGQIFIIFYLVLHDIINLAMAYTAISISFGLSLVIGYINVKRVKIKKLHVNLLILKNWQFSKWLVYSAILQWGTGNFFILVAGAILGSWAVGVIRVMQNTMGIFHVLFIVLENILPISFSKIYKKDGYIKLMEYFGLQLKYGVVIFTLMASFIYLFSEKIIDIIYGNQYVEYSYLLTGFIVIYMFIYITMLQRYILRTIEQTKAMSLFICNN